MPEDRPPNASTGKEAPGPSPLFLEAVQFLLRSFRESVHHLWRGPETAEPPTAGPDATTTREKPQ
jgi:hypothetical protein